MFLGIALVQADFKEVLNGRLWKIVLEVE